MSSVPNLDFFRKRCNEIPRLPPNRHQTNGVYINSEQNRLEYRSQGSLISWHSLEQLANLAVMKEDKLKTTITFMKTPLAWPVMHFFFPGWQINHYLKTGKHINHYGDL